MTKGIRKSKDKQEALILSEFGGVDFCSLDIVVGKGYAVDDKNYQAWAVDGAEQFMDKESGEYIQLLTTWSFIPVNLSGVEQKKITLDNVKALATSKFFEELQYITDKTDDSERSKWLARAAFMAVGAVVLMVLWKLISSGTLGFPGAV